jgi:hypothetical protein
MKLLLLKLCFPYYSFSFVLFNTCGGKNLE